jgi:hypothetical protein
MPDYCPPHFLRQRAAQYAFSGGHGVGLSRIDGDGRAQRARQAFVTTLDDMMVVSP